MPDYTVKEAQERSNLEKQINAQMEARLAKLRDIQSFNNQTAASIDQQYTKLQMISQEEEMRFNTQKEAYDILTLSAGEQEEKLALIQQQVEKGQALSELEAQTLDTLLQGRDARLQGADAYAKLTGQVRQNLATQKQITNEAKEQQQINDVFANDVGVRLANSLGLVQKKQKSITKEFMKSKHKAKFLKNAVKGLVSQISLVNIGTKMMKSGFQLMVGMVSKVFGMGGGGGGANLSEFVKMTGHASGQMHGLAKETAQLAKRLKVGFEEGGKAVADLMSNMSGFMTMSKNTQKTLATGAVKMMAFGVSAETSAKLYEKFTNSMGMNAKGAVKIQRQMFFEASKMGMNIAEYQEGFLKFSEEVPGFGNNAVKAYRKAAAAAKALGFANAGALAKATEGFDNYEDSAKKSAMMNQVFGKSVFDSSKLMMASLEGGPGELAKEMNKQLQSAGINFKDMSRAQKLAMAESSGKSVDELEKLMQGKKGMDKMARASKRINNVTNSVKKFNQAIKKTKPPGGGGSKDFLTMVLKSYNKLTGGKFFKKIKLTKKGIKHAIQALADYIAGIIRDMEKKFQDFGKEFLRIYKDNINAFGDFFGIDDLSGKLTDALAAVKDMFPLLLPMLPMLAGAGVALLGVFGKLVGMVPTLVGGFISMGKGTVTMARRGGEFLKTMGGSGSMMDKLKGGWATLSGDNSKRDIQAMAKEAKPVIVANSAAQTVPTTGGGGAGGDDGGLGGAGSKATMMGKIWAGAKGFLSGGGKTIGSRLRKGFQAGKHGGFIGKAGGAARYGLQGGRASTAALNMAKIRRSTMGGRIMSNVRGAGSALKHTFKGSGLRAIGRGAKAGKIAGVAKYTDSFKAAASTADKVTKGVAATAKTVESGTKVATKAVGLAGKLGPVAKFLGPLGAVATGALAVNKVMEGDFKGAGMDVGMALIALSGGVGLAAVAAYQLYDHMRDKTYPAMVDHKTAVSKLTIEEQILVEEVEKQSAATKAMSKEVNNHLDAIRDLNPAILSVTERFFQKGKLSFRGKSSKEHMNDLAAAVDGSGEVDDDKMEETINAMKGRLAEGNTKLKHVKKSKFFQKIQEDNSLRKLYKMDVREGMKAHSLVMDGAKKALKERLKASDANEDEIADALIRFSAQRVMLSKLRKQELQMEAIERQKNEQINAYRSGAKGFKESEIVMAKEFQVGEDLYLAYLLERKALGQKLNDDQTEALRKLQGKKTLGEMGFNVDTSRKASLIAYNELLKKKFVENSDGFYSSVEAYQKEKATMIKMGTLFSDDFLASERGKAGRKAMEAAHSESYGGVNSGKLKAKHQKKFVKEQQLAQLDVTLGKEGAVNATAFNAILTKYGKGNRKQTLEMITTVRKQLKTKIEDLTGTGKGGVLDIEDILTTFEAESKRRFGAAEKIAEVAAQKQDDIKKRLEAQSYKVKQKDIDNLATYRYVLEEFSKTLEKTDIGVKMAEFMIHMDKLIDNFAGAKAQKASGFMENLGIMFYNARAVGGRTGKNISKLGVAMQGMVADADTEKFKAVATALASVGAVHVKPGSKSAIDMLKKANEEFPKLKKHIEEIQESTAGKLFFKGGNINQKIDTTTTVKLVIGAKDFGRAALHGLKETGHTAVKVGGEG